MLRIALFRMSVFNCGMKDTNYVGKLMWTSVSRWLYNAKSNDQHTSLKFTQIMMSEWVRESSLEKTRMNMCVMIAKSYRNISASSWNDCCHACWSRLPHLLIDLLYRVAWISDLPRLRKLPCLTCNHYWQKRKEKKLVYVRIGEGIAQNFIFNGKAGSAVADGRWSHINGEAGSACGCDSGVEKVLLFYGSLTQFWLLCL